MFDLPTSLRLRSAATDISGLSLQDGFGALMKNKPPPHSSHPNFGHLTLLVFEAVMEVVFVSLPGYIVARQGLFDAEAQKFVANLNVMVFTPCLIFTKLAAQLNADKLADLAIIPVIFITQTFVSWFCSWLMSKIFRFKKRPANFVTAMAVFGNSNSLPISLVLSLSKTISGLHWDAIPGDNDDEVAARGILYLLIFQQLGQLVRWTWGYNILLKPREEYPEEEQDLLEEYIDDGRGPSRKRTRITFIPPAEDIRTPTTADLEHIPHEHINAYANGQSQPNGHHPPNMDSDHLAPRPPGLLQTPANGNYKPSRDQVIDYGTAASSEAGDISGLHTPNVADSGSEYSEHFPTFTITRPKTRSYRFWRLVRKRQAWLSYKTRQFVSRRGTALFNLLPKPVQKLLSRAWYYTARFLRGVWHFMNPPLWAMVAALVVASIPALQELFFAPGTFLSNSIVRAVQQSGGVAVPLILVVLGANLARNTLPADDPYVLVDERIETRLLVASLLSRMLLPTVVMAPVLALIAKYAPVSIMDDPIFLIVCFLLTGAPSALQLAQICQINGVYMGAMSKLLFQSYVVWILPSTLILVMCALEVVEWSTGQV